MFRRGHAAAAGTISIGLRALLLLGKFAFIVALARYTDTSTVGVYALLVTLVSIAIYVTGLELHTYTGREIVSVEEDDKGAVHVQSHLITLSAVYLIALPFIWGFTQWLDLDGRVSFPLLAALIFAETLGHELGRYLLMLSRPVASNLLQFIRGAAWMPVPVGLLIAGQASAAIDMILLCWLGGALIACAFGLWHIRRYLKSAQRFRLAWLKEAFSSTRHYFAIALLTQVQYYSDRFVVQFVLGESAVGILSFYQSFANTIVAFVQTGVVSVILPRLILAAKHRDVAGELRARQHMFRWGSALAAAICTALALGMPFLLRQIDKAAYASSLPVFYLLLVANFLMVIGIIFHLYLYSRKCDPWLMRVSLAVVPLGLSLNAITVPMFGIMGAACTAIFTASADAAIKYWLVRRLARRDVNGEMGYAEEDRRQSAVAAGEQGR